MPCLKNHGMHLTFVEEFNTKHCVYKASPYYFFSFLNTPPQFSPSWTDIFIARLWFGKLWVGKVQGQDVQKSTAHLWREPSRRASSCWKNGMSDGRGAEPTEGWGERRCLRGKEAVNYSQWEVLVPFQNLTFSGNTWFSDMGASLSQPIYLTQIPRLPWFHQLGTNRVEGTGGECALRVGALPPAPSSLGQARLPCLFLAVRWHIGTPCHGIQKHQGNCSSLAFPGEQRDYVRSGREDGARPSGFAAKDNFRIKCQNWKRLQSLFGAGVPYPSAATPGEWC